MHRIMSVALGLCMIVGTAAYGAGNSDGRAPAEGSGNGDLSAALEAIAGRGMIGSHAFEFLTELSDDIGARVTGSPQAAKAIEWGLAKMKSLGLQNVHAEKWQMSRGWTRGSADGELLAPIQRRLSIDAMGWVGSTPAGGVEAEVVQVNLFDLENELKNNSARWSGKVLLVGQKGKPPADISGLFPRFGQFLHSAPKAGIVAVIGGQGGSKATGMHLTHTGALGFDTSYEIPVVSMTMEDQSQLERYLNAGKTVRIRINVQNHLTPGPVESANVVGEIAGSEHPEQVLVVGAHLDSWDLSEGTTDNGTGSCSVLGAAEAIARSGHRPRRTIRFVLFTGEEQGLLGSLAYVKQHQAEMVNHLGSVVLDSGQGPVNQFNLGGRDDLLPKFNAFVERVRAFGDLKADDDVEFGTDTGPFTLTGLPGINLNQDSPDYKYTHHSAGDSLEAVKPDVLIHNATLMALTAYWIADQPERFASPWPPEKTAKMLVQKHQDGFLKAFNLWPFGELGGSEKTKPSK
jgi:carboxypeptidase Q